MLCLKMWSRNFIPDYGIKLLSVYLVLTTLAAKIYGVDGGVNRKLLNPDNGCQDLNIALVEYYNAKKKLLESKTENITLQNEKLRLEIRKLKGEDS